MDILTMDDLLSVIEENILEDVTGGDETVLDAAEIAAIGEMTGYLDIRNDASKCFDRDLSGDYNGINTVIQKLVDITLFNAHAKVMPHNVPELREKRYNNAINWLEKVSSGFISPKLPVKDEDPTTPLRFGNSSTPQNPYF